MPPKPLCQYMGWDFFAILLHYYFKSYFCSKRGINKVIQCSDTLNKPSENIGFLQIFIQLDHSID